MRLTLNHSFSIVPDSDDDWASGKQLRSCGIRGSPADEAVPTWLHRGGSPSLSRWGCRSWWCLQFCGQSARRYRPSFYAWWSARCSSPPENAQTLSRNAFFFKFFYSNNLQNLGSVGVKSNVLRLSLFYLWQICRSTILLSQNQWQ